MVAFQSNMRARTLVRLLLALLASAPLTGCNIGCWFMPCDKDSRVLVAKVADPSGAPIQGASIDMPGYDGKTDLNGCVELRGFGGSNELAFRAEAAGRKPYSGTKPDNVYRVDVVLEPNDSPRSSTAAWSNRHTAESPMGCL